MSSTGSRPSRRPECKPCVWCFPFLLILLTGCFSYRALETPDPAEGADVRVRLTPEAAERLNPPASRAATGLTARVISVASDSILLAVPRSTYHSQQRASAPVDRIQVARRDLATIEVKRFSVGKTALVYGALGIAAAVVVDLSGSSGEAPDDTGERPGEPATAGIILWTLYSF